MLLKNSQARRYPNAYTEKILWKEVHLYISGIFATLTGSQIKTQVTVKATCVKGGIIKTLLQVSHFFGYEKPYRAI